MARQTVNLQTQISKLNPGFWDCPEPCSSLYEDGEARCDLPDFCSSCEVRKQLEFFEGAARHEISRRFPDGCEFSFDRLSSDVARVQRIDKRMKGKGYPRNCDELTATLLDILRAEEYRPTRIHYWELAQKKPRDK
jgi:hypothetical protein